MAVIVLLASMIPIGSAMLSTGSTTLIAGILNVNPDPFLTGVAVAASSAFLTPIGHKNNTLIMGPGGYRFGDYWRMGLPLEIIIVAIGRPHHYHRLAHVTSYRM